MIYLFTKLLSNVLAMKNTNNICILAIQINR